MQGKKRNVFHCIVVCNALPFRVRSEVILSHPSLSDTLLHNSKQQLVGPSHHHRGGAFKHCATRQQPFANLLHQRSLHTLQQLSAAVSK